MPPDAIPEPLEIPGEEPVGPGLAWRNADRVRDKLLELYDALIQHPGYGEMRMDVRILKKGRKEVILSSGRQFRFVLQPEDNPGGS